MGWPKRGNNFWRGWNILVPARGTTRPGRAKTFDALHTHLSMIEEFLTTFPGGVQQDPGARRSPPAWEQVSVICAVRHCSVTCSKNSNLAEIWSNIDLSQELTKIISTTPQSLIWRKTKQAYRQKYMPLSPPYIFYSICLTQLISMITSYSYTT